MTKVKTIDLKGKEYAQVKERLKQFRDDCPNGLIETFPTIQPDTIMFKARILKNKSDASSAEATGHAYGPNKGEKAFEKLETIAVGRALALLGYAQDGEVASGEEMEEFIQFQEEKKDKVISAFAASLEASKDIKMLQTTWATLPGDAKAELETLKDELKAKLTSANASS